MKTLHYFLLLGGNQGNEHIIFERAIALVSEKLGTVIQKSALYQSPAWGFESNDFINQAIEVTSSISPLVAMQEILNIEQELGRIRSQEGYSSRSIDIDILLIDKLTINENSLIVPHPRLQDRKFALTPLSEIAESQIHSTLNKSIFELLKSCSDHSSVKKIN
jgi:deoxyguanosine kinase